MSANLEISTCVACSNKCEYCPQTVHVNVYAAKMQAQGKRPSDGVYHMSYDDFVLFMSTVPQDVDIVFAGMAEPFMNRETVRMMQYIYEKGNTLSVFTTCLGMTMEDVEAMKQMRFNHFCLHLPDADGKMNIRVTEKYLEVLAACLPLHNNLMCIGRIHPDVERVIGHHVADGSHGLYSRAGNLPGMAIPRKTGRLFCSACTEHLNHNVLMPNGDVLLCCMDYAQKHVLGNLNDMKYADLFTSAEYNYVRQALENESMDVLCRNCEVAKNI